MRESNEPDAARDLLRLIDSSPSPYHAAAEAARRLEAAGFVRLREQDSWQLAPGARVYAIRGGSSVAAFIVGHEPAEEAGFLLVGAHTDSPNLRVKPTPDLHNFGYHQLAVEVYGGVLWSTWLDRDLSLAGRVVLDDGTPTGSTRLVDLRRAVLRIPNLAIHLNRTVNSEGLKLNAQLHLVPVAALDHAELSEGALAEVLAEALTGGAERCEARQILSWDLCLYDTQPAALGGLHDEFIFAARLDNLASCHAALHALTGAARPSAATRGIVLYDHEEVGSDSAQGAGSPFLSDMLARLAAHEAHRTDDALRRAVSRSLLISADMAHAVHPNYSEKHEPSHRPVLGQGPVIKTNVAQSYATDAETSARFRLLCQKADVKPQYFVSRGDMACGSTIGPISASRIGLRTVDVGNPLLSMHSIREMAAVADVSAMQRVLAAFFDG